MLLSCYYLMLLPHASPPMLLDQARNVYTAQSCSAKKDDHRKQSDQSHIQKPEYKKRHMEGNRGPIQQRYPEYSSWHQVQKLRSTQSKMG